MKNSQVQTLEDLVRYGSTSSYSIKKCSILTKYDNLIMLDKLAYSKYDDLLLRCSTMITLTDEEFNLYKFHPEKLSQKLYGTINLDHLILWLNRTSVYDFNNKRVRILNPEYLDIVLKTILSHESDNINKI